jgi:hypothetical protein
MTESLINFFSDNKIVIAIANVTAVFVILSGIWRYGRIFVRFISEAYKTNIKTALKAVSFQMRQTVNFCSEDMIMLIAYIAHRSALILVLIFAFSLSFFTAEAPRLSGSWIGQVSNGLRTVLALILVAVTYRLHFVTIEVAKRRRISLAEKDNQ